MQKLRKTGGAVQSAIVCFSLVAATSVLSFSNQAAAQSLPDAMVAAYHNSPELAAARANVKVSSELAVQARSFGRALIQ